jgi:hypothetical protein
MGAPLSRSREARLCAFPLHIADLGFTANVATYTTTSAMRLALMDFALCTSPEGQFQSDCSNLAVIGPCIDLIILWPYLPRVCNVRIDERPCLQPLW